MGGSQGSPGCCQLDSCRGEVMVPSGASTEGHASCFLFFIFRRNKWNFSSKGAIGGGKDVAACSPVAQDVVWGCCGDGLPVHPSRRAHRCLAGRCRRPVLVLAAFWKPTRLGERGAEPVPPQRSPLGVGQGDLVP